MTQHRPGPETAKPPASALERLENAMRQQKMSAFARALKDCVSQGEGNWQHRALKTAMERGINGGGPEFLTALLACPKPPKPDEEENFLGLAFSADRYAWTRQPLVAAGFQLKPGSVEGVRIERSLGEAFCRGQWRDFELIQPPFLHQQAILIQIGALLGQHAMSAYNYIALGALGDRKKAGFLNPDNCARVIALVDAQLDEQTRDDTLHDWSHSLGRELRRIDPTRLADMPAFWQEGYLMMRRAGIFNPTSIQQGLGDAQKEGYHFWKKAEAEFERQTMEQATSAPSKPARARSRL